MKKINIALDGPAGAGKSTIAKLIAKKNHLVYIDTGAMYRALTLKILNTQTDIQNKNQIEKLLLQTKINIDEKNIILDGEIVNEKIRTPEVNNFVSYVAKIPMVRKKMVELQRKIAENKNVIMDGRDIATNVLPNATHKFYLTASINERAKRRFIELNKKNFSVTLDEVKQEIQKRDKIDTERKTAPLKRAKDAILIDTTGKSIEDVVEEIQAYLKK